jgi:anti-anti-sigma factor
LPEGEITTQNIEGDLWLLTLRGEHDLATSPSLRDEIDRVMTTGTRVIVDLTTVEFIDSTVIAAVLHGFRRAQREHGDEFVLVVKPGSVAERTLGQMRVSSAVPTFPSRHEALSATDRSA